MRVTSIEHPRRGRRYLIRIDDAITLLLSPEVLAQAGLSAGQLITQEQVREIEDAEARHNAMAGALRLLAYRARTEKEIRDALARRGFGSARIDAAVGRLKELRLLDDAEFARSYVETRHRVSPRSRRALAAELRAKGITISSAQETLASIDEPDAAYRAAAKRARSLHSPPFAEFQRKLGDYLLRRGFGHKVTREAVRRTWHEMGSPCPPGEDDAS